MGRAVVEALHEAGAAKIYATARNPETLQDVCARDPARIVAIPLDVREPAQIAAAALACADTAIVVNNAGVNTFSGLIAGRDFDNARLEMETNYFGTLRVCRAFAPILVRNGAGAIVNMLSIAGQVMIPLLGSLCASKAALISLTEGVRAELRRHEILVMGVTAGAVDTDMARDWPGPKTPPAHVASSIMSGLVHEVEDVYVGAMAAAYRENENQFAKEMAAYVPTVEL